MKYLRLRISCILSLAILFISNAFADVRAPVQVTSTSGGALTTTLTAGIYFNASNTCPDGSALTCGMSSYGDCSNNNFSNGIQTWGSIAGGQQFPLTAGTHTYYLNIQSSTNPASLDQILCSGGGACNVCICANASSNETATTNGNCTSSTGQIVPTCDSNGHVISVVSTLTLNCP